MYQNVNLSSHKLDCSALKYGMHKSIIYKNKDIGTKYEMAYIKRKYITLVVLPSKLDSLISNYLKEKFREYLRSAT